MAKTKTEELGKTLLLIDSHALIHRAYHAFPPDLRTADGEVVNAVYGFGRLLLDVLNKFKPSHVVALSDAPGGTVRHDQFSGYKANRSSPDDDMIKQIPRIEELLDRFGIPMLEVRGYEADDLIGTIDARHSGKWARTIIVTGDRDLFQLVDEDTFVYLAGSQFSKSQLFDAAGVKEKMGIGPEYITDLKGLYGDTSDNIPGVYGIGEKGAVSLISRFGHIEELFKRLEEVEPRYRTKLENNFEQAELSKKLATIITDVPVSFDFEEQAKFGDFDPGELKAFFSEMQFASMISSIDKLAEFTKIHNGDSEVGSDEDTIALPLDVPEIEFVQWNGDVITGEEIFVDADISLEGDPLRWKLAKFTFSIDNVNYEVPLDKMGDFVAMAKQLRWVCINAKAIYHVLMNRGIEAEINFYDISLSTYLLSSGQSKQDWDGVLVASKMASMVSNPKLVVLPELYNADQEKLAKIPELNTVVELEQSLITVVADMERAGIRVDIDKLNGFADKLQKELDKTAKDIFTEVGHEFNIGSPKQVGEVLFIERGLPTNRKTKSGGFSTDERTLRELVTVDPVVGLVLKYRELSKLLSTYLAPLPQWLNEGTKHLHTVYNQLGAVTGRFSSQNPNLQNIPLGEVSGVNIREAFIADTNSVLVAFDYSQQELRLLAELSKEENMLDSFRNNEDIHKRTAAEIFDLELSAVTDEQRKIGKTVNFGVVYGISAFGLSDRLKIDPKKASEFIKLYFQRYPQVRNYYDQLIAEAKVSGFASTVLGRRRDAFGLTASNFLLRQATEREIMNFPLQGSAADITKKAMIAVAGVLKQGDYPAVMVLQVHDELVFQYNTDKKMSELSNDKSFLDFVRKVRETMLGVIDLQVPLEVGVEVGGNWGDMTEIEIK